MNCKPNKIPGWIGIGLITTLNALWLFWGLGEAFYEGWGVPETPWVLFLTIPAVAMVFSIIAIRLPYVGGGILMLAGLAFAIWWLIPGIQSGLYSLRVVMGRLYLSAGFAIVGLLFILDGALNPKGLKNSSNWFLKNLRMILAIGIPLLVGMVVAAVNLPTVLTRLDDGNRSARLIERYNVELIWAPAGPGWNWKQDFGGYPSWDSLASYGIDPPGLDADKLAGSHADAEAMKQFGLCAFLSEDGKELLDQRLGLWRMPTVEEISGSLSLHHRNAKCEWNNEKGRLDCELNPDKETPLWAPDEPPVYYWAADAFDYENAYYVSYTGWVAYQPKNWGNPRHGYRCVKEP